MREGTPSVFGKSFGDEEATFWGSCIPKPKESIKIIQEMKIFGDLQKC